MKLCESFHTTSLPSKAFPHIFLVEDENLPPLNFIFWPHFGNIELRAPKGASKLLWGEIKVKHLGVRDHISNGKLKIPSRHITSFGR